MKMITPTSNDDGMVFYGRAGLNVETIFGIRPDDFLQLHEQLVIYGLKTEIEDASTMVDFVLYVSALVNAGSEIEVLIREFNASQKGDGTDLAHALSLSKLYYHYWTSGYNVRIQKTHKSRSTPDLVINDVECDLKVRHDQTHRRMVKYSHLLSAGRPDEYNEAYSKEIRSLGRDLRSAFASRVEEGFNQAACVFLDLSSHFHSWNFHRLQSMEQAGTIHGLSHSPIPAIANTCILFSPDNAKNLNGTGFHPQAYWGYLQEDTDVSGSRK